MTPDEIKYEFKVRYKANPHYAGHWHSGLKPGLHGTFDTMAEAVTAQAKCRKWFNEENVILAQADDKGVIADDVKTTIHDNVVVWIESYENGVLVKDKKEKAA